LSPSIRILPFRHDNRCARKKAPWSRDANRNIPRLNATPYNFTSTPTTKSPIKQNTYGGTVGGPVADLSAAEYTPEINNIDRGEVKTWNIAVERRLMFDTSLHPWPAVQGDQLDHAALTRGRS